MQNPDNAFLYCVWEAISAKSYSYKIYIMKVEKKIYLLLFILLLSMLSTSCTNQKGIKTHQQQLKIDSLNKTAMQFLSGKIRQDSTSYFAIKTLSKAYRLDSNYRLTVTNLSSVYTNHGKFKKSANILRKWAVNHTNDYQVLYAYSMLLICLGKDSLARVNLLQCRSVLQLKIEKGETTSALVINQLFVLKFLGKSKKANELYKRFYNKYPTIKSFRKQILHFNKEDFLPCKMKINKL